MALLSKILKDLEIKSLSDLEQFIQSDKEGSLRIVKGEGMKSTLMNYEVINNEIHGDFIELENMILDVAKISIFPKEGIVIKNCVFVGEVSINGIHSNDLVTIEIENCIFLNELIFAGFKIGNSKKVYIFHTNAACVSMFNIKASEIIIIACKFFFLSIHKIDTNKFETENNIFKHIEIESCKLGKVIFDHRQFDMSSMGKRIIKSIIGKSKFQTFSNMKMDMNLFLFIPYKTSLDIQKSESYNTIMETIGFLKNSTSLSSDRNNLTKLMFFEVLLTQDSLARKAFVWITGGFLKPFRFIIIALITSMFFSGLYMLPVFEFSNSTNGLSLDNALYFSGVTFTTLGYGDIYPIGISRLFAILEAIVGICTMNCLLVALVKKYID